MLKSGGECVKAELAKDCTDFAARRRASYGQSRVPDPPAAAAPEVLDLLVEDAGQAKGADGGQEEIRTLWVDSIRL